MTIKKTLTELVSAAVSTAKGVGIVGVTTAALAVSGCGNDFNYSGSQLYDVARDNGIIIHYNGFAYGAMGEVADDIADTLGTVEGNGTHTDQLFELLRLARDSRYGVTILAHSAGEFWADNLIEECNDKGIPIRGVHVMDGFTGETFPNNVEDVFNYTASEPWVRHRSFGGQRNHSEGVPRTGHFNLPYKVKSTITERISGSQRQGYQNNSSMGRRVQHRR